MRKLKKYLNIDLLKIKKSILFVYFYIYVFVFLKVWLFRIFLEILELVYWSDRVC